MFFAIPNLSSQTVTKIDPWTYVPDIPLTARVSKKDFINWETNNATRHCFYSAYEGVLSTVRVDSVSNPPHLLHGLVADYDNHNITNADIDILKTRPVSEWNPTWACRTFSGGARLVWLFEEPLRVPDHNTMKEFLRLVCRKLKLRDQLAGFDKEDAFEKPQMYYEVGSEWRPINEQSRIPNTSLNCWMFEAGNKVDWSDKRYNLPIVDVAREVNARWPGRWPGEFLLDTRGPRFWDSTATNPTACIVRESGMQCFSGGEPFMSWAAILGQQFVDKYQERQIGMVTAETFFDGKEYWRKDKQGLYQNWNKDDMTAHLRVAFKLRGGSQGASKGSEPGSETDKVLHYIKENNRVQTAMPFVHMPAGRLTMNNMAFLNIANAKCLPPADEDVVAWGQGFPWLAGFFDNFFDPTEQKEWFFSWLKRFYGCALQYKPEPGQAVFIVGPPGTGKTLLSNYIVATMVGGFAEGSEYLLGNSNFTGSVLSQPLVTVDDMVAGTDVVRHARYSAMIKKIVANEWLRFEEKYQKAGRTRWRGRAMVTCNADPEGLKILPNMEQSNLEKVALLRCRDGVTGTVFAETRVLEENIAKELPYFCKWLLAFEVPQRWLGMSRYGIVSYHQAQLYRHSLQGSSSYTFYELLEAFVRAWGRASPGRTHWEGNATQMLLGMMADEGLRQLASKYQANQVSVMIGRLKSLGYNITKTRDRGSRSWRVPVDITPPEHTKDDLVEAVDETKEETKPADDLPETRVVVG